MQSHRFACVAALMVLSLLLCVEFPAAGAEPAPAAPANHDGKGIFVAVGYGGRRMSSRDGIHWENVQQWAAKGADDSNNLISLAYGKGKFIAVGGGGWTRETNAGHILVSTDGAQWHEVRKAPFRIAPIMFESGRFVAGGPNRQLLWSDDGETWSQGATIDFPKNINGFFFRRGIAGNGVFIFTGNGGKDQKTWWCATSKDGQSITSFAADLPEVRGLAFGAGKFVLMSPDAVYTSIDGKTWNKEAAAPADSFQGVAWTGKEFFLAARQSSYISADGVTWKPSGKPIPCNPIGSDGSVYIGSSWPGKLWYSTDGQKWTQGDPVLPVMGVNQIVYGVPAGVK